MLLLVVSAQILAAPPLEVPWRSPGPGLPLALLLPLSEDCLRVSKVVVEVVHLLAEVPVELVEVLVDLAEVLMKVRVEVVPGRLCSVDPHRLRHCRRRRAADFVVVGRGTG